MVMIEMRWQQDAEECVRNPKLQIVWFQALILHLTHVLKVLIDLLLHRQIVRCTELLTDWLTLTDTLTDKLTYCWRANTQSLSALKLQFTSSTQLIRPNCLDLLTDWLTNLLYNWLTKWLMHQLIPDWLTYWLLSYQLKDWLTDWLTDRLTLCTDWMMHWLVTDRCT